MVPCSHTTARAVRCRSSPEYGTGDLPAKLAGHDAVIVPNASRLTEFDERALDSYVGEGGALLATLSTSLFDENGVRRSEFGLRCLRAATPLELSRADMNAYLRFDANLLPGFPPDIDVVPVHGDILEVRVSGGASAAMSMTGPEPDCIPEDAYIREWTEQPGLVSSAYGDGRVAYLPWAPDRMYHEARQPALEALLMGALTGLSPDAVGLVEIDAPPFVEIAAYRQAGRLLLHLVNAGGCWDGHFDDPVPVQGIRVCVDGVFRRATALGGSVGLEIVRENGRSVLEVPELALYEVVSLEADRA